MKYKPGLKMPTLMNEASMLILSCTHDYIREYEVKTTHTNEFEVWFICPECGLEHKSKRYD